MLLRTEQISAGQVRLWDGVMVPVSRILDRVLFHRFGKNVLAVWRRSGA